MARVTDAEITGGLKSVLDRRKEQAAETREASDGGEVDGKVRAAIEAAIELQKQDPDLLSHYCDRRVLCMLNDALEMQLEDESTDGVGY